MFVYIVLAMLFVLSMYLIYLYKTKEQFGSLLQLYAKGPEDMYLTSNTIQYVPDYRIEPPTNFIWNNPTRLQNYYYPLYGSYLRDYYSHPYYFY